MMNAIVQLSHFAWMKGVKVTVSAKEANDRKQRIRDAAYVLFKDKGVDNVTFHDISALSGISEASVYHYYKKKSYLLLESYKHLWEEIARELEMAKLQNIGFWELDGYGQIECIINAFENVYVEHGAYLKFAMECKLYWNRHCLTVTKEEHDGIIAPVFTQFEEALKKGREDHSIHIHTDYQAGSFLLWGILHAYVEQIVIFDGFYCGENRYRVHFQTMKDMLLKSLR